MRWAAILLLVLVLVPAWTGEGRRGLFRPDLVVSAAPFAPPGGWPARIGMVRPIGALALSANQPGFGGFSALAVHRDQAILLSDGGNIVRLRIAGGTVRTMSVATLRDGPDTGWRKQTRDTEAMAIDPVTGCAWVGYERVNEIWRYAPGFTHAEAWTRPAALRRWGENSGAETLVRLADGRFLAVREGWIRDRGARPAVLFAGDPTRPGVAVAGLRYLPPPGFSPSDAAELPDGDIMILNRRWILPLRFEVTLVRVPRADLRAGALLRGVVVARLGDMLNGENAEGIAVTRERGRTIIWLVTDNDGYGWRKTILAKFRLIE